MRNTSVEELGRYSGYYNFPHTKSARMFYFFFESRNNNTEDPVVIWLTGGPGCSGSMALFYEIMEDLSLSWNDFGWDKVSNLIYVDQPVGTGCSYTNDNSSDIRHNETGVSIDLYDFLQAFFKEHPKFVNNDFYLTGESYAGHYSRIQDGNKNNEGIPINLKGVAIGNGLTDPEIQYGAYRDFALEMKLISEFDHESLKQVSDDCQSSTRKCNLDGGGSAACKMASDVCELIYDMIMSKNEDMSPYDVRKKCLKPPLCDDFSRMVTFLNQENVKKALGVGDRRFETCNGDVSDAMEDWMINFDNKIPPLVEDGIKVLVYAGEYDFICNWLGNLRWVEQMNWSGQKDFGSAKTVPFMVDGEEAGLMKNHGPLTFLKYQFCYRFMTLGTWFRWISQKLPCECFRLGCKESLVLVLRQVEQFINDSNA